MQTEERRKILIVDDDPMALKVIRSYLKDSYKVYCIRSGEEALKFLSMQIPDVVLLDYMMPGMDGYRVCERIRSESDVPIILITAKGEDYERVMGLDIGADDYMVKPVNEERTGIVS